MTFSIVKHKLNVPVDGVQYYIMHNTNLMFDLWEPMRFGVNLCMHRIVQWFVLRVYDEQIKIEAFINK